MRSSKARTMRTSHRGGAYGYGEEARVTRSDLEGCDPSLLGQMDELLLRERVEPPDNQ
jgi:hypothetical protein